MQTIKTISEADGRVVSDLKRQGHLVRIVPDQFIRLARNGGIYFMCSDGDIDAPDYHAKMSHRPHGIRVFGGAMIFARSFGGYSGSLAVSLLDNLQQGMNAKATRTLFLYFHAPCGMAEKHGHGVLSQLEMAKEARRFFTARNFPPEKVHLLFHVKRINRGGALEQNTYLISSHG